MGYAHELHSCYCYLFSSVNNIFWEGKTANTGPRTKYLLKKECKNFKCPTFPRHCGGLGVRGPFSWRKTAGNSCQAPRDTTAIVWKETIE